ncbi:VOC family protein [Streptomyces sp. XM4193]|uniref:VOC family protein n=1 Tax=Streptomyces sp. XM4193 TaxID=2929782 RepID=UPI001FF8C151|nr:VOC family protein [Streptomyces sp. XM4193]MCK1796253.1 VOC family protein [Streptomyces sp. XM4193]
MLRTERAPGAPAWIALETSDAAASAAFYGELFGWRHRRTGRGAEEAGRFTLDGLRVAGTEHRRSARRDRWTVRFRAPDPAAALEAVRANGGTADPVPAATAVTDTVVVHDPTGGRFTLGGSGGEGLETVDEPGALTRVELCSTDADVAAAFYRAVLGWEVRDSGGCGGLHRSVAAVGRAAHGGIVQLPAESRAAGARSQWQPWFAVVDCDAVLNSAVKQGASVLLPPTESAAGRLAVFADPAGAVCGVLSGEEREAPPLSPRTSP